MVDLLAEYEKVGLQLNCRELPDYLPLYLEYLSVLPDDQAKEGLLNVAPILALLGGRLKQREAPWYALFDALLQLQEALCQVTVSQNRFAVKSVTTPARRWMRCGKKNR
ncbi:respiratory nitrate reductase 2 subunit delta [Escherichia coli]|uniref:Respiratory nitrate reductase 2 subunit delta n=1 Tax=Escherichia coli TaxID=562 RepID=A0A376W528_ECOLX|nr:respiratory nitrate reductase 2 subunit delta [Escherichia coli]